MNIGRNAVCSDALSQPINTPNKMETNRKEPSATASNAELGNKDKIKPFIFIPDTGATESTVIGILGSFTIKTENKPINARITEERIITINVQEKVFRVIFDVLNLLIEIIVVEKTKGTTIYFPNFITNSDKKDKTSITTALFNGKIKADTMPKTIPSKYLIQTFIFLYYNILWNHIPEYVII